jgi:glycosyltransferase involved in cell wall biosynthesis
MRICLVISRFFPEVGGAERQAHALARMLLARGHQVTVLTQQLGGLPKQEVLEGVPVFRAIRTIDLGPLFGLTYVLSVARYLLAHRRDFDVLHVFFIYLDAFTAVLTRPLHRIPVLVRPACAGYYGDLARLTRFRVWPLFPALDGSTIRALVRTVIHAEAFIANSQELRDELLAAGFPPDRIAWIPNGVDLRRFRPDPEARTAEARRRLGLPPGPLLVFVGRLDPQKGLHALIAAMQSPAVEASGAHLLLLGDGPQRAELEQAVRRGGMSEHVLFRGLVADVAPYLRACDIFVFPSLGEGMPNALLEAMASGLPCVASAIGGCRDVITDGQTGVLVPAGDAAALRGALEELLQSPALRERLGAAAQQDTVARFGLEKMVARYEACYRAAIAGLPVVSTIGAVPGERS